MKKINTAFFVLILCLALGASAVSFGAEADDPVAVVNGVAISKAEYYELLEERYGLYALQELVEKELVRQRTEELQIEISEEELAEVLDLIVSQLGGPENLQLFLREKRITQEMFLDHIRWTALLSKLAKSEVEINDDDLAEWFEANRQYFDQPEAVEVSHILVETEVEAEEILQLLEEGEDFAALAGERSSDRGTVQAGGYLGFINRGFAVQEFEDAAFSLAVDQYGLAKSSFGWHVIWVQSKVEAEEAVFAEIYDSVVEAYRNFEALDQQSYLMKLRLEAEIEILGISGSE